MKNLQFLRYRNLVLLLGMAVLVLIGIACRSQSAESSLYVRENSLIPDHSRLLTATPPPNSYWTPAEIDILKSLWLGSLPLLSPDPSNAVADDPRAAALGHRLFFDTRLSANNQVSCATCHVPELAFTDGVAIAHGTRLHSRNTLTIIGTAYSPWLMWDGHKDSQWAQAIGAIEHPDEQGSTRLHVLHLIGSDETYRTAYEALFEPLPDLSNLDRFPDSGGPVDYPPYRAAWESMSSEDQAATTRVFVNIGKAIAAYERLIRPGSTRFDAYVQAVLAGDSDIMTSSLTSDEVTGLRLFIGQAGCIRCHKGPLLTDNRFHNTGTPPAAGLPIDDGRATGVERVFADEFNCLSRYSDARESECATLTTARSGGEELRYAFKTPTLRGVAETGPYMHAGQLANLHEVLAHYNQAPLSLLGQTDDLSDRELAQLEAFLRSLSGLPDTPPELLTPPQD